MVFEAVLEQNLEEIYPLKKDMKHMYTVKENPGVFYQVYFSGALKEIDPHINEVLESNLLKDAYDDIKEPLNHKSKEISKKWEFYDLDPKKDKNKLTLMKHFYSIDSLMDDNLEQNLTEDEMRENLKKIVIVSKGVYRLVTMIAGYKNVCEYLKDNGQKVKEKIDKELTGPMLDQLLDVKFLLLKRKIQHTLNIINEHRGEDRLPMYEEPDFKLKDNAIKQLQDSLNSASLLSKEKSIAKKVNKLKSEEIKKPSGKFDGLKNPQEESNQKINQTIKSNIQSRYGNLEGLKEQLGQFTGLKKFTESPFGIKSQFDNLSSIGELYDNGTVNLDELIESLKRIGEGSQTNESNLEESYAALGPLMKALVHGGMGDLNGYPSYYQGDYNKILEQAEKEKANIERKLKNIQKNTKSHHIPRKLLKDHNLVKIDNDEIECNPFYFRMYPLYVYKLTPSSFMIEDSYFKSNEHDYEKLYKSIKFSPLIQVDYLNKTDQLKIFEKLDFLKFLKKEKKMQVDLKKHAQFFALRSFYMFFKGLMKQFYDPNFDMENCYKNQNFFETSYCPLTEYLLKYQEENEKSDPIDFVPLINLENGYVFQDTDKLYREFDNLLNVLEKALD